MIDFACEACGKAFSVPETFAGRRATCKKCGSAVVVPTPVDAGAVALAAAALTPAPASADSQMAGAVTPKLSMRTRRLLADAEQMRAAFGDFAPIRVRRADGDPPDVYQVEYRVQSLQRGPKGKPIPRDEHLVEIRLTSEYPRLSPRCRMLTPIFHPNIDPDGTTICVGDHWTAGERLAHLVIRIGEMIAYQAYNIQSPLDGEAAMWADLNAIKLPLDARNLHPPGME